MKKPALSSVPPIGFEQAAVKPASSDKRLTPKDLSPDQRRVYSAMLDWTAREVGARTSDALLTVGGLAGVGKTTLLGVFAKNVAAKPLAFVSYTGRAASVLGRKLKAAGVQTTDLVYTNNDKILDGRFGHLFFGPRAPEMNMPFCGTLHRLLYKPIINASTDELMGWSKRETLDRQYQLVVVDEASMVGDEMLADLRRHAVPLLAVGDHGQLPPVMSKGSLMEDPTLKLEKIHRQSEGSAIIQLAHAVRNARMLDDVKPGRGLIFDSKDRFPQVFASAMKQARSSPLDVAVVCWTNRTRGNLNVMAREVLGLDPEGVSAGEVLVCLKNYPPVFNGMRGVAKKKSEGGSEDWTWHVPIEFPEEGLPAEGFDLCIPQLGREKTYGTVEDLKSDGMPVDRVKDGGHFFDWGYTMTCHKMQGSGVPHVIWYVDRPEAPWDDDYRRFAYTAITRASGQLTVLR